LNYILGIGFIGWIGAAIYPIAQFLKPPKAPDVDVQSLEIGKVDEVENNTSKMFKMGGKPAILIRTKEGEFRAFYATCTHLDCTVQLKGEEDMIWCACHNGVYDLFGKNISGPPPSPLREISVTIQKNEIFVSK
jgi:Rieske Fe-S protein